MKYLSFIMDVTKVLSTLSKTFQSAELCITDILTSLETTLTLLEPFRQEKGPQYKKFKEGCCEETSILQEEPLIYFRSLIQKKHPKSILVWQHLAKQVKSLHEHFSNNYLTEEEETTIIAKWPALHTRLARQKATVPLKGKLPVASRFRRDMNRVARHVIRVAQDSPKQKCLA